MLEKIFHTVQSIEQHYQKLSENVDSIQGQVNFLSGVKQVNNSLVELRSPRIHPTPSSPAVAIDQQLQNDTRAVITGQAQTHSIDEPTLHRPKSSARIILTTYPGQSGIDPLVMNWGHPDPIRRGPIVVSRSQSTIRRRNGE